MYNLRGINNMYEGGTRSDFVVTGNPEYQLGRQFCTALAMEKWDTKPSAAFPAESVITKRVRASGGNHLTVAKRLYNVELGAGPTMKERALAKSANLGTAAAASMAAAAAATQGDAARGGFDEFMALLRRGPEAIPSSQLPFRVTSGAGNHLAASGCFSHYARMTDELTDLCEKLRKDPVTTERDLLIGGSWKYYAKELERLRKHHGAVRAQQKRSASSPALHASQA